MTTGTYTARLVGVAGLPSGISPASHDGPDSLVTDDGDTSVVRMQAQDDDLVTYYEGFTFQWEPDGAIPSGVVIQSATFEAVMRRGPDDTNGTFGFAFRSLLNPATGSSLVTSSATYATVGPTTFYRSWGIPSITNTLDAIATGERWWAQALAPSSPIYLIDGIVTRLRVLVEYDVTEPDVDPPIRLYPRGDGLGLGSGRVFDTGTPQASGLLTGAW